MQEAILAGKQLSSRYYSNSPEGTATKNGYINFRTTQGLDPT
jgi:hypothetical protein